MRRFTASHESDSRLTTYDSRLTTKSKPSMTNPSSINFSGTDSYLQAAMSGLAARQRTIANNVSNVDTPGFKTSEVRFEDAMNSAISRGDAAGTGSQSSLNRTVSQSSLLDSTSTR